MLKRTFRCLLIGLTFCAVTSCAPNSALAPNSNTNKANHSGAPLSVLYAGSMTKAMEQAIRPNFQQEAGIPMEGEGAGSLALAHMISSELRNPDVFISASPSVNETLMGAANHHLADWYITLARDEMVIAYSPKSRYAELLQAAKTGSQPWYHVLEKSGFLLGRTDPLLDPKGINTILTVKLAAAFYHDSSLFQRILGSDDNPRQVYPEETLLSRLSTGQLDAVFAYKHEAVEWGFPYVSLPAQVNLGDSQFSSTYATASYTDAHGKTQQGAPIVFTITALRQAPNPTAALKFVQYMLTGEGHSILLQQGFDATPATVGGNASAIPVTLHNLVSFSSNSAANAAANSTSRGDGGTS